MCHADRGGSYRETMFTSTKNFCADESMGIVDMNWVLIVCTRLTSVFFHKKALSTLLKCSEDIYTMLEPFH